MRSLEKRIARLEIRRNAEVPKSARRLFPDWLFRKLHEETGLPFHTDEVAMDSIRRIQEAAGRAFSSGSAAGMQREDRDSTDCL